MYFNITSNTFRIWAVTVLFAIALYESLCYLLRLFLNGRLRISMFLLYMVVLYPHYYTWWSYFNYTNDEYYNQWNHQTFFSVTELVSTATVLFLCDRSRDTPPRALLLIIAVATLHILASGVDQFVKNVILMQGHLFQIFRDLGFMGPDLCNILIPLVLWRDWCRANAVTFSKSISLRDVIATVVGVVALLILCNHL